MCTHTHKHTHTHTHTHTRIHAYTHTYTYAYTHTHTHTHTCIRSYPYIYIYPYTYTHAHTHTHIHTHTHTHIHIYIHIHIWVRRLSRLGYPKRTRFSDIFFPKNHQKKYFKNVDGDISATKKYYAFKLSLKRSEKHSIYDFTMKHIFRTRYVVKKCWMFIECEKKT